MMYHTTVKWKIVVYAVLIHISSVEDSSVFYAREDALSGTCTTNKKLKEAKVVSMISCVGMCNQVKQSLSYSYDRKSGNCVCYRSINQSIVTCTNSNEGVIYFRMMSESFECYQYSAYDGALIDSLGGSIEAEIEVCENRLGHVFTNGDGSQAPGCGLCWCCRRKP